MDIIFSNIISTGIYYSSIAQKGVSISKERKISTFEIDVPIESGGVSYIDDSYSDILPDVVIFAKPGQIRHTKFPLKCHYVHLSIEDEWLSARLSQLPDFIPTSNSEGYRDTISRMQYHFERSNEEDEVILQSLSLELAYMLLRDGRAESLGLTSTQSGVAIADAKAYIKQNLAADLSLEAISSRFGFCPTYFHKLFRAATGKTLHDYVEEQRIKRSLEIMTTTSQTLTEIAYECGFSSQSYFSYAFKRRLGITPREYAKRSQTRYEREKTV